MNVIFLNVSSRQGTLHVFDLCAPFSALRSAGFMSMGDTGTRDRERRRAPRYHYQASLEIEWGSARLKGRTRDISAGGMFIESEDVLWVGAGFRARLAVERVMDKAMWLDCHVKRVVPGHGMGVSIALPENQSQQHFEDLLSKLSTQR